MPRPSSTGVRPRSTEVARSASSRLRRCERLPGPGDAPRSHAAGGPQRRCTRRPCRRCPRTRGAHEAFARGSPGRAGRAAPADPRPSERRCRSALEAQKSYLERIDRNLKKLIAEERARQERIATRARRGEGPALAAARKAAASNGSATSMRNREGASARRSREPACSAWLCGLRWHARSWARRPTSGAARRRRASTARG